MNVHLEAVSLAQSTDTKTAIEQAALRLFVERGIAETSIKEVARAAKVSQGHVRSLHQQGRIGLATLREELLRDGPRASTLRAGAPRPRGTVQGHGVLCLQEVRRG